MTGCFKNNCNTLCTLPDLFVPIYAFPSKAPEKAYELYRVNACIHCGHENSFRTTRRTLQVLRKETYTWGLNNLLLVPSIVNISDFKQLCYF
jgi:hypothetical protein